MRGIHPGRRRADTAFVASGTSLRPLRPARFRRSRTRASADELAARIAILVDDMAQARRVFENAGAPIESERDIPGMIRFFTRDPDGNRIEVVQNVS